MKAEGSTRDGRYPAGVTIRVVLELHTTNVLWPLPGNRCRWTFQLVKSEMAAEFPEKERQGARVAQTTVDERIRQYVEKVAKERAPWFSAGVKELSWCTEVVFEHRVARQFGRDRCWVAGDAAHQTGPVGVQSMNVGMAEAASLAGALRRILREKASLRLLEACDRDWQVEWRRLLGLTGGLKPRKETNPWLQERRGRIFAARFKPPAQQPVLVRLSSLEPPALWEPVFDPNKFDTNGTTTIDWYVPSLDGRLAAICLSESGSEDGTLHFFDTDTGKELDDQIPRVQYPTGGGSVAWLPDNSGILYTRYPHAGERPEVRFHRPYVAPTDRAGQGMGSKDGTRRQTRSLYDGRGWPLQ